MYTITIKKQASFDIEEKVAEGVEQSNCCNCSSDDCKQLPHQLVELRLVLTVNDVDWLDLGHEHKLGERLIGPGRSSP